MLTSSFHFLKKAGLQTSGMKVKTAGGRAIRQTDPACGVENKDYAAELEANMQRTDVKRQLIPQS